MIVDIPRDIIPGFTVRDLTKESDDKRHTERPLAHVDGVAIHRLATSLGSTADEISRSFQRRGGRYSAGAYTGHEMPYTLVVTRLGDIQQALPLSEVGPHARRFSASMIGVAVLGDFRTESPGNEQWSRVRELSAWLCLWCRKNGAAVYGHDELPGGSADPEKSCPGKLWDMHRMRLEVSRERQDLVARLARKLSRTPSTDELSTIAEAALMAAGVIF